MKIEMINIGNLPNDGAGDPLRVAFSKINNNFITAANTTVASGSDGTIQYRATNSLRTVANRVSNGVSIWIAAGYPGKWWRSTDLSTWTPITAPTQETVNSIVGTSIGFIAVGNSGVMLSSLDGIVWNPLGSGVFTNLNDIDYNVASGLWTVVGDGGLILTSTNAITWTRQSSGLTTRNLYGVTSRTSGGTSLWVAVGAAGTVLYSTNGSSSTWAVAASTTTVDLNSVTAHDTNFYAVGDTGVAITSTNAVIWNLRNTTVTENLTSVIGANLAIGNLSAVPTILAVGANGTLATTIDGGINWSGQLISGAALNDISWGNSQLVTVGNNGGIFTSATSTGWANISIPGTLEGSLNFVFDAANSNLSLNANIVPQVSNSVSLGDVNSKFKRGVFGEDGVHLGAVALRESANTLNISYVGNSGLHANIRAANAQLQGITGTSLSISGTATFSDIGNVQIGGGGDGYIMSTDGQGNLAWIPAGVTVSNIANIITSRTPQSYLTNTVTTGNLLTLNSTDLLSVNQPIAFTGDLFGNIQPNLTYWVKSIIDSQKITISSTRGGAEQAVITANGNATVVSVDTRIVTNGENYFTEGAEVTVTDVGGMVPLNGNKYWANLHTSNTFSIYQDSLLTIPVNSLAYPAYTTGGRVIAQWSSGGGGGGNVVAVPAMYFTAPIAGNNQQFSNIYLSSYESAQDLTVFLNGSLLESGFYTLNGTTLTVTTELAAGDSVDIIRQFAANLIQPGGGNGVPGGNNTELQFNNNGTFGGISTVTYSGGNISLGAVSNVKITGGSIGQVLSTDGNGNLSWTTGGGSGGYAIPAINFTAINNANNQTFSNSYLAGYNSNTDMTVFTNGVLLETPYYTLSGDTLTINVPLTVDDTVTVARQMAGNINNVTSSYGNSNVQQFLDSGTIAGNIVPGSSNTYYLGSPTQYWLGLYISGNTIYLGNSSISAGSNGNILYDGNPLISLVNGAVNLGNANLLANNLSANGTIAAQNVDLSGSILSGAGGNVFYDGNPLISLVNGAVNLANANLIANNVAANGAIAAQTINLNGSILSGAGGNVFYDGNPLVSVNTATGNTNLNGNLNANTVNANTANVAGDLNANTLSSNNLVVSGTATIAGNLAVTGNVTYSNANTLVVEDPIIQLGGGANGAPLVLNDGLDRGTLLHYYTTQPVDAFMGWKNVSGEFIFGSNVTNSNNVITVNQLGNVRAGNFFGNIFGNATGNFFGANSNLKISGGANGQVLTTDGTGNLRWATVSGGGNGNSSGITVGTMDVANQFINSFANITTLGFDEDSGFDVIDLGNGVAKVAMNSTFKFWEVDGAPGLTAEGLDTVNFITGNNISIVASNTASPKSIEFAVTASGNTGAVQFNNSGSLAGTDNFTFNGSNLAVKANVSLSDVTLAPGANYFSIDGNGVSLGQFAAQSITVGNSGIVIGGTGGVRVTGAAGSGVTIGGGSTGQVTVASNVYLGNVANVRIGGGNIGWGLTTDGNGNLSWQEVTANVTSIPAVYFTAPVSGNNQSFSNIYFLNYQSNTDMTVFKNGTLLENSRYTLNSSTLTITTPLLSGDKVQVVQQFAANVVEITGRPAGSNMAVQYNLNGEFGAEPSFTYDEDQNLLTVGSIETANITSLDTISASNITVTGIANLGNASNVKIAGGQSGQFLQTTGNGNTAWNYVSNLVNGSHTAVLDGTGNLILSGGLTASEVTLYVGSEEFSYTSVYSHTTTDVTPDQMILALNATNISGIDFTLISTDNVSQSRQITKITSAVYGSNVVYNETNTMFTNDYLANWSLAYQAGYVTLNVTPTKDNDMRHRMQITIYAV
jgi:hypothetical protein